MNRPASFSYTGLTVKAADDGFVSVTVRLPSDLLADYCCFLDSLTNFLAAVKCNHRSALDADRRASANFRIQADKVLADYHARLVALFDQFTAQGCDRKESVKRVAAVLRAEDHPWRSPELVRKELVKLGRGARRGRSGM